MKFSPKALLSAFVALCGVVAVAGGLWLYNTFYGAWDQLGLGDPAISVEEKTWPAPPEDTETRLIDLGYATIEVPADAPIGLQRYSDSPGLFLSWDDHETALLPPYPRFISDFGDIPEALTERVEGLTALDFRLAALQRDPVSFLDFMLSSRPDKAFAVVAAMERQGADEATDFYLYESPDARALSMEGPAGDVVLLEPTGADYSQTFILSTAVPTPPLLPSLHTFAFKPAYDGTQESFTGLMDAANIPVVELPEPAPAPAHGQPEAIPETTDELIEQLRQSATPASP